MLVPGAPCWSREVHAGSWLSTARTGLGACLSQEAGLRPSTRPASSHVLSLQLMAHEGLWGTSLPGPRTQARKKEASAAPMGPHL